ncbi:MAG: efflux RND transporter periplasmic adaptor subunit [Pseudomonadota bacterium]
MDKSTPNGLKLVKATAFFFGALIFILIAGSHSPFGISFGEDNVDVIQPVITQKASFQESYSYKREFIGQIEAQQSTKAGFEIDGMLKKIYFEEGDAVKKGDILASLDIARLNASKNEAQATLASARADAKLAEVTYKRYVKARKSNAISQQEQDEARENRDKSRAAVKVAEAQLETIMVDISKSRLVSPFDGTIIRRIADEGDVVAPGETVLEVQDHSDYDIRVGVAGELVNMLSPGEIQNITISGQPYQAKIKRILPVRDVTRVVDVILELSGKEKFMRPGDIVRMPLETQIRKRGFWVPITALKEANRGLWSVYIVLSENDSEEDVTLTAAPRLIEVHYADDKRAFISGTVYNGDDIIISGAAKIVPGQNIRVIEDQNVK